MPERLRLVFISAQGMESEVEAAAGRTLMQAAVDAGVPGLPAICGGQCSCGTCRVVVDAHWCAALPAPAADELAMLGALGCVDVRTRLSCQVRLHAGLDGLRAYVPAAQD